MSVQLTLYPQNFQGFVNTSVVSLNQLSDSLYFVSLFSAVPTYGQAYVAVNGTPATTNWNSYCTATFTPPAVIFNWFLGEAYMVLYGGNGSMNISGTYQKLTNLIIGQTYEVLVDIKIPRAHNADVNNLYFGITGAGLVTPPQMMAGNNPPMQLFTDTTIAGWTDPITFVATQTEEIAAFTYGSSASPASPLSIGEIIVRKATVVTSDDGQLICDLYNEDLIPLTLSVDTFKNAGEKQQSYSKAFQLPATKHNNKIFENIFELTRDSMTLPLFNPYRQTRAVYKEDGHIIFQGFMRLIDVLNKNGEISYNVNLYSESVALASLMKAEKMSEIDLGELSHAYDRVNIFDSINGLLNLQSPLPLDSFANNTGVAGALTTNVLKYPVCNWDGQIAEQASLIQVGNGANVGMPSIEKLQTMFRPWIKIKYIIDRLFARHGFTYSSTFLNTAYFNRLFMDFNWGKEINWAERLTMGSVDFSSGLPVQSYAVFNTSNVVIMSDNNTFLTAGYDETTGIFTAPNSGIGYDIDATVTVTNNSTASLWFTIRWRHTAAIGGATTSIDIQTSWSNYLNIGETITLTTSITSAQPILINDTVAVYFFGSSSGTGTMDVDVPSTAMSGTISGATVISGVLINTQRGKLKQWDVFKGIMDMFNLVTLQDDSNPKNLIIEPYNDIFNAPSPTVIDWSEKIDTQEVKFKPMDLTQSTMFQYSEDKDYPFTVYKNALNGYLYGSLEWTVPSYTQVKGETKVEAKPFAATIVKPFFDSIPDWVGACIYKGNADATQFEGIDNKPRILYDVTGDLTEPRNTGGGEPLLGGVSYYVPPQNGQTGSNVFKTSIFSHVDNYPSTSADTDLNYGACQLIGIGVPPVNNLFTNYYEDYFYELYNPDTRTVNLKVLLTANDIVMFNFSDRIRIKNSHYRVSKINYKPNQLSDVEFILIK